MESQAREVGWASEWDGGAHLKREEDPCLIVSGVETRVVHLTVNISDPHLGDRTVVVTCTGPLAHSTSGVRTPDGFVFGLF